MIQLIQNIQGNFVTEIKGEINYVKSVEADLQKDDFINIFGLTGFLQNLSQTPKTKSLSTPNLFGYSVPVGLYEQTLDFSTCNRTATWYNMQESPEYVMNCLVCNLTGPTTGFNVTMTSLIINGIEHLNSPTSVFLGPNMINWVPANNNIVYSCTTGNATGWTYTNFVDFLNNTFGTYGLNYEARLSYKTINVGSNSVAGFYLINPENDIFSIKTISEADSGGLYRLSYENGKIGYWEDNQFTNPITNYYKATNNYFNYDCETNTIIE